MNEFCLEVIVADHLDRGGRHHGSLEPRPGAIHEDHFRILVSGFFRDTRPRELAHKRKGEVWEFHVVSLI
jgi:hypothetical protein